MSVTRTPRWALSFADLTLLLLGFFVILHARAGQSEAVAQGMRAAFGGTTPAAARTESRTEYRASQLFQPGEAVLTPAAARWLAGMGAEAAKAGRQVTIVSAGRDAATARLDGWELAAARVAAAARAVRAGGLREDRLILSIPAMGGKPAPQTLKITSGPPPR